MMALPPVTEEDKPAVESIILRLKGLRKRDVSQMNKNYGTPQLDDAITGLMEYGAINGWWEFDRFI